MLDPDSQSRLDSLLSGLSDSLAQKQPEYHAQNGRYWQGGRTHDATPSLGYPESVDAPDWAEFGVALPDAMDVCFQVDTYDATGEGYILSAKVKVGADLYCKSVDSAGNTTDWSLIPHNPLAYN